MRAAGRRKQRGETRRQREKNERKKGENRKPGRKDTCFFLFEQPLANQFEYLSSSIPSAPHCPSLPLLLLLPDRAQGRYIYLFIPNDGMGKSVCINCIGIVGAATNSARRPPLDALYAMNTIGQAARCVTHNDKH